MGIRYLETAPALLKKIVCHEKKSDGAVPAPSSAYREVCQTYVHRPV
ncbi:hypothetical protein HMPREF9137_0424 [Prevotella denticola F0289]|nr:hypothetical protein HMPREF9137_0424 [Prevotella denticola F0289]